MGAGFYSVFILTWEACANNLDNLHTYVKMWERFLWYIDIKQILMSEFFDCSLSLQTTESRDFHFHTNRTGYIEKTSAVGSLQKGKHSCGHCSLISLYSRANTPLESVRCRKKIDWDEKYARSHNKKISAQRESEWNLAWFLPHRWPHDLPLSTFSSLHCGRVFDRHFQSESAEDFLFCQNGV